MIINKKSPCKICENEFQWWARINLPSNMNDEESGVQASVFCITGSSLSTDGVHYDFEAIVTCPRCGNNNKLTGISQAYCY